MQEIGKRELKNTREKKAENRNFGYYNTINAFLRRLVKNVVVCYVVQEVGV